MISLWKKESNFFITKNSDNGFAFEADIYVNSWISYFLLVSLQLGEKSLMPESAIGDNE